MVANTPTEWPGIGRPIAHADLPQHLFRVAALHARRALADATDDLAVLDRAGSIGISMELLAKSALAHLNPALLAAERESKHLLLFSGVATVSAEKAKTRTGPDCLAVLRQANHPIDYSQERDAAVFDVRNLAQHLGFVDPASFDGALNTMVALAEQIIAIVASYDPLLDRAAFWGLQSLPQVDERLKAQAEARRLKLEQLKAAAMREIERLRARGLDDDILSEWADREPPAYFDEGGNARDDIFVRRPCPACKFEGWLEYLMYRGPIEYDYGDNDGAPVTWVDVEYEPREFHCQVCSLRLGDDLLYLEGMGETRYETVDPTPDELLAAEEAAVELYYEEQRGR
ncbi:hypothetical protein ACQ86B_06030 [Mycolicibacterium aichiense]|uniref:hypothetical protein n=1 Tax=Mycolicibacterium aichiense TaxID=1799 RepID=UPI003D67772C